MVEEPAVTSMNLNGHGCCSVLFLSTGVYKLGEHSLVCTEVANTFLA